MAGYERQPSKETTEMVIFVTLVLLSLRPDLPEDPRAAVQDLLSPAVGRLRGPLHATFTAVRSVKSGLSLVCPNASEK